jgi:TRAP-type mannitol/chloroaromatic compound transport system permease small subunit
MESFIRFCDRLSLYGGVLAGVLTIVALILVCAEMVVDRISPKPSTSPRIHRLPLMAALTFLALAYTLDKSHIRMVFLHESQSSPPPAVDLYAFAVGFLSAPSSPTTAGLSFSI